MRVNLTDGCVNRVPPQNFTDNDIKKGLECCKEADTPKDCKECPFAKYKDTCEKEMAESALDLINRYEAKIAELTEENNRQQAEIERLTEFLDDKCDRCIEKERTEAVNEFANELCRVFAGHSDYHGDTILTKIACLREGKPINCAEPIDTNNMKTEAVKEFAEEFKTSAKGMPYEGWLRYQIDIMLKERAGETNA